VLAAGLLGLTAIIVVGSIETQEADRGLTTEVAMAVMFLVGAVLANGPIGIAVIVGGTVAILLHLKPQMHSLVRALADADITAIMQFVLITLVILPILPNRFYGPFQVLNPYRIWLMVVLIVGINLGGYIVYKFFGDRAGTLAGGILGGLISSTATTVSYARRSRVSPESAKGAAVIITVASTIVFARILLIIGAVAPGFLRVSAVPIGIVLAGLSAVSIVLWRISSREPAVLPEQGNPSEFKTALIFAGLYSLVLLGTAAARYYFGQQGLFIVSVASGLTDVDAITLSLSEMVHAGLVEPDTGWRLVIVAALSNLAFKAVIVAVLGSKTLLSQILVLFGIAFSICFLVLLL
jgi:uncharacterized membrane protein (DUF4010 family)